jgi:hypothetical protein
MAGQGGFSAAWNEACTRVFASGFDRSLRAIVAIACVAGALFLAHRGGGVAPASVLSGLVAVALFLSMPLVTIFAYVLGLSFIAGRAGVADADDPSMPAVFVAFGLAIAVGAVYVSAAFSLPMVGAQLRLIFT